MMHGMIKQVNTRINKRFGLIRKMRVRKVWLALIDVLTQRQTLDWYHSAPKSGRGFLFQWAVMSMLKAEWVEHLRRRMRCWFRRTCFWFQGVFAKINYFEAIHYVALMFMIKCLESKRVFKDRGRPMSTFHLRFIVTSATQHSAY